MMKLKLERKIKRINRFESKWNIQTSEEKFKVILIAQYKTQQISVNGSHKHMQGRKIFRTKTTIHRLSRTCHRQNKERQRNRY